MDMPGSASYTTSTYNDGDVRPNLEIDDNTCTRAGNFKYVWTDMELSALVSDSDMEDIIASLHVRSYM
jgi:hypothetical protein